MVLWQDILMQIEQFKVNNFKSLVDFQLDMPKFTCLIGLNGAGKSTVLQFIDFLGQQVRGNMKGWLEGRVFTRLGRIADVDVFGNGLWNRMHHHFQPRALQQVVGALALHHGQPQRALVER